MGGIIKMSLVMFFSLFLSIVAVFESHGNPLTNPNPNPDPGQDSEISISTLREELEAQKVKFRELEKSHELLSVKLDSLSDTVDNLRTNISEDHGVWLLRPPLRGPPGPQGAAASLELELDFPSYCTTAQLRFRASSERSSIKYPTTGEYGNYLDLCYIISSPPDGIVSLNVTRVETEARYDYLVVYKSTNDLLTNFKNLSGNLGQFWDKQYTSNVGEPLLVHFHSDGSNTGKGFTFSFDTNGLAVEETEDWNGTGFGNYSVVETLFTGYFVEDQSDFTIPGNCTTQVRLPASFAPRYINYPESGQYGNNLDLCYIVSAPSDERVLLNVTRIKTEAGLDYLNVYKSANGVIRHLQNFTGDLGWVRDEEFTSNVGEPLILYFHSDGTVTDQGFSFSFSSDGFNTNRNATAAEEVDFDYES